MCGAARLRRRDYPQGGYPPLLYRTLRSGQIKTETYFPAAFLIVLDVFETLFPVASAHVVVLSSVVGKGCRASLFCRTASRKPRESKLGEESYQNRW